MKREKIIKRLYWLGIISLVTSLIWVSLAAYRQMIKNEKIEEDKNLIVPIQPNLKSDILPTIINKKEYTVDEVSQGLLKPTATPTLAPTGTPEPTIEPVVTAVPTDSEEGDNQ